MIFKRVILLIIIIILIFAGYIVGSYVSSHKSEYDISKSILQQINFTVFGIRPSQSLWKVNGSLTAYNKSEGVLTLHYNSGVNTMTINEQTTPSQFSDIPDYSSAFLGKLNEYGDFQDSLGDIALTHPTELSGRQSAVLNSQGTLLFAQPKIGLSRAQWQTFFQDMTKVQ